MKAVSWFHLRRFLKRLSVRAALFAVLAVGAALLATSLAPYVPKRFADLIGGKAVDSILTIIASSMLAVVTFSLSIMVNAYTNAATSATPRATSLLVEDSRAQTALSIFLGAFIYSIVGLVALATGYYGPEGRVILFMTTAVILVMVVVTIVRWIDQLSNLGRIRHVISSVEEVTTRTLGFRLTQQTLRCEPFDQPPQTARRVIARTTGFVQTIDLHALDELAELLHSTVYVNTDIGAFVHYSTPVTYLSARSGEPGGGCDSDEKIRRCFVIGPTRTFEDDPTYGLTVLSEVACRALSPAINDPGTAIDVVTSLVRILTIGFQSRPQDAAAGRPRPPAHEHLRLRSLSVQRCIEDAFDAIGREGARQVEVASCLQDGLAALALLGHPELHANCVRLAARSLERCQLAMELPEDFDRVRSHFMNAGSP